jgi:Family of unknown function (DUF6527)
MPGIERLRTVFIAEIPEILEDGILYVSEECQVALHNCACGCGEEVSTPLVRTEYRLSMEGGEASVWPSIGNHDFACKSHYVIRRGRVLWAREMTRAAIEAGRERDRRLKRPLVPLVVQIPDAPVEPTALIPHGVVRMALGRIACWVREILASRK